MSAHLHEPNFMHLSISEWVAVCWMACQAPPNPRTVLACIFLVFQMASPSISVDLYSRDKSWYCICTSGA